MSCRRLLRPLLASVLFLASSGSCLWAQTSTNISPGFTLEEIIQRVLDHNESVQMEMLEAEISRKVQQAERGIFEPQVVGSVERIDSQRPNNTQQLLSLGFSSTPECARLRFFERESDDGFWWFSYWRWWGA